MSKKIIITVARQYGSGGREIGEKIAAELGIPLYDKETKSYPMEWRDLVVMVEGIQESPENRLRRLRAERKEYIV